MMDERKPFWTTSKISVDETKRGATLPSDERDRSTQRDARLSMIGMARSALPTHIAERKDEYIADAILHRDAIEP